MKPSVHISVICRNPELFRASTLVFDSIRIGFPTSKIVVLAQGLSPEQFSEVEKLCNPLDVALIEEKKILPHEEWLGRMVWNSDEPLFICDTDIIFWDNFEKFSFDGEPLAGRYIPSFHDEATGFRTYDRLHTCLMYIDPVEIAKRLDDFYSGANFDLPYYSKPDLIAPMVTALNGRPMFHDSMSQLYHAVGGAEFSVEQLDCFDHLCCGTFSDLIEKRLSLGRNIRETHRKILDNPAIAKGCWRGQDQYYNYFK